VPEQEDDLLEGRMLGEVVDVVALIDEHPVDAVHVADGRFRRHHAFESSRTLGRRGGLAFRFVHDACP
jgi:hypothetical protein